MARKAKKEYTPYNRSEHDITFVPREEIPKLGLPTRSFSFGERLDDLMNSCGVSNYDLSDKAKLSERTISRLRSGNSKAPTPRVILQIAAAMQLYPWEVEDLFEISGINLSARDNIVYRICIWRILDETSPDCLDAVLEFIGETTHIEE